MNYQLMYDIVSVVIILCLTVFGVAQYLYRKKYEELYNELLKY